VTPLRRNSFVAAFESCAPVSAGPFVRAEPDVALVQWLRAAAGETVPPAGPRGTFYPWYRLDSFAGSPWRAWHEAGCPGYQTDPVHRQTRRAVVNLDGVISATRGSG
jgi:hypothetical protein